MKYGERKMKSYWKWKQLLSDGKGVIIKKMVSIAVPSTSHFFPDLTSFAPSFIHSSCNIVLQRTFLDKLGLHKVKFDV